MKYVGLLMLLLWGIQGYCAQKPAPDNQNAPATGALTLAEVSGIDWELARIRTEDSLMAPLTGTRITLNIGPNGAIKGDTSVNIYRSGITISEGNRLHWLKPIYATRRGGPAHIMQQERRYLSLLQSMRRIHKDGERLLLSNQTVGTLEFAPQR